MRANEGNRLGLPVPGLANYVVLCAGFGCFFAVCPFSALGTAAMLRAAMGWQEIHVARVAFLAFSAIFFSVRSARGLGWYAPSCLRPRMGGPVREALLGALSAAVGFVVLAFGRPLLSAGVLAVLWGCLLGFAMAALGAAGLRRSLPCGGSAGARRAWLPLHVRF